MRRMAGAEIKKIFKQTFVIYGIFILSNAVQAELCCRDRCVIEGVQFSREGNCSDCVPDSACEEQPPLLLKKCCPLEQVFNFTLSLCEPGEPFSHELMEKSEMSCNEVVAERQGSSLVALLSRVSDLRAQDYCVDGLPGHWILRTCEPFDFCETSPCVRKCCRDQERFVIVNRTSQCAAFDGTIKPVFHEISGPEFEEASVDTFGILQGMDCVKYVLDPDYSEDDEHHFHHKTGRLHITGQESPVDQDHYCLERVGSAMSLETFVCFSKENPNQAHPFFLYGVGMAISSCFFFFTFLVYICVPQLMNLHGKTLVANVLSFFVAFTVLSLNSFRTEYSSRTLCLVFAYVTYFSLISGFLWLNVMCFDIWWTFGSIQGSRMKSRENKRFFKYCCYACSVPLLMTTLLVGLQFGGGVVGKLRPKLGEEKCWFQADDVAYYTFFLVPVGCLTVANLVLFILTIRHCNKVKADINRLQDCDKKKRFVAHKERFYLNMRLFIVMGASWILEVVSTVLPSPTFVWYLSDIFNALLGVFVFLIFVCKRKVWDAIKTRLGLRSANESRRAPMTDTTSLRVPRLSKSSSSSAVRQLSTTTS